ncbi:DUF5906 domain-containing protein [Brockia lithotrophica]|uniref:DUF5906 domain-containing protein n=1 Tax=Brockia lithotrophica TaxID=933949 RepID=UPI000EB36CEB|nr:DUF5906 domain-containing protein [Brockia lithotrophica]
MLEEGNWKTLDELETLVGIPHAGVGFVFTAEDGLVGIDLDDAFTEPFVTESAKPWAREILERFRGAYVTWSPSGKGAHIIVRGVWGFGHKTGLDDGGKIEVYDDKRFFTMTGHLIVEFGAPKLVDATEALDWLGSRYFGNRHLDKQESFASLPHKDADLPPGLPDKVHALRRALEEGKPNNEVLPLLRAVLPLAGELGERAKRLIQGDTKAFAEFHDDQSAIEQSLANAFAVATGGDAKMIAELLTRFSPRWEKREKLEREDYLERTAEEAVKWYHSSHRVEIDVDRNVLEPSVRKLAIDALRWRYEGKLFRYGDVPVAVDGNRLFTLDATRLSILLADAAIFRKGSKKKTSIDPPERLVKALVAELTMREELPELRGIVRSPVIFPDGRVVRSNGYDPVSGLLFVDLPSIDIPNPPTKEDASKAYMKILDILGYSFASPADESAAVAYLLTAVLRPAFPLAPLFLITAPEAGSGKTTLAQVGGIVAHGRIPDILPEPENEEEFRKRVEAALLEGRALIILDNLHRDIRSATLEAAITSETISLRPLGRSETRTVPNSATFVATGNNIAPFGDMRRRTVVIRLEGRQGSLLEEKLEGRENSFLHDIRAHRGELLSALLTIVLAYHHAGRPNVRALSFPSFEMWARMVRDPLVWLGAADPVETVQRTYDEDENAAVLEAFFEILYEEFGTEPFSARDVAARLNSIRNDDSDDLIRDLASQLKITNRFGEVETAALGYKLRAWRDRVFGGFRLERVGTGHAKMTKWRLVPVSALANEEKKFQSTTL